jgi:hypothetical protein
MIARVLTVVMDDVLMELPRMRATVLALVTLDLTVNKTSMNVCTLERA